MSCPRQDVNLLHHGMILLSLLFEGTSACHGYFLIHTFDNQRRQQLHTQKAHDVPTIPNYAKSTVKEDHIDKSNRFHHCLFSLLVLVKNATEFALPMWKFGVTIGPLLQYYPKDMDVSKNGGTQQPLVFLLKMIILGCFGGTPIFGNTHLYIYIYFFYF